jgi:hypothetical protein
MGDLPVLLDQDDAKPASDFAQCSLGIEEKTRAHFICLLVCWLDRHPPVSDPVWRLVDSVSRRLLAGRKVELRFIRDSSGPEHAICPLEGTVGGTERVRETGILAHYENAQHSDWPDVVRYAKIEIPPREPEIVASLRKLASAVVDADPRLKEAGGQLADELAECASVGEWWTKRQGDYGARALIWRVVQRAAALLSSADVGNLAEAVLDQFEKDQSEKGAGLFLTAPPRISAEQCEAAKATGPMFLVDCRHDQQPLSTRRGVAIRMPDKQTLMPALLLRVPISSERQRPLLECLANLEPVLAELRIRDSDWEGWKDYDDRVFQLVWGSDLEPSPQDDERIAVELFMGFYGLAFDTKRSTAKFFKQVARAIYQCLVLEMSYESVPPLNVKTLQCERLGAVPGREVEIEWDFESGRELGTTIHVTRFGRPGKPGKLKVSAGPRFPADLAYWPNLPAPPLLDRAGNACPLANWHKALQRLPFDADRAETIVADYGRQFGDWLIQEDGRVWLDLLCQEVRQPSCGEAASQWFAALRRGGWLGVFPDIDPKTRRVSWPKGASTVAPGIQWLFNAAEIGAAVEGLVRFAPDVEHAQGCFSLGPQIVDSPLDLALRLEEQVVAGGVADPLLGAVRSLTVGMRDQHVGVSGEDVEKAARAVLDALPAANEAAYLHGAPAAKVMAALEGALKILEQLCRGLGLSVVPQRCASALRVFRATALAHDDGFAVRPSPRPRLAAKARSLRFRRSAAQELPCAGRNPQVTGMRRMREIGGSFERLASRRRGGNFGDPHRGHLSRVLGRGKTGAR